MIQDSFQVGRAIRLSEEKEESDGEVHGEDRPPLVSFWSTGRSFAEVVWNGSNPRWCDSVFDNVVKFFKDTGSDYLCNLLGGFPGMLQPLDTGSQHISL